MYFLQQQQHVTHNSNLLKFQLHIVAMQLQFFTHNSNILTFILSIIAIMYNVHIGSKM